jgi:hypothetical protein
MTQENTLVRESIEKVERWVEAHKHRGYEPFDGLSSFLKPLTFNKCFLQQVLQQIIRQSPINLRPILGVRPLPSTKGTGYMARGHLNMFKKTGDSSFKDKMINCLEWLDKNKSPFYSTHSWGNHFDYASRSGKLPKYEPTIVWTSLIGQAFLDAYELFGKEEHLNVIKSVTRWILDIPRERTEKGNCLSYIAYSQSSVHNSNMLGAAFLSRAAKFTKDSEALETAHKAMEYSCSRQMKDGAWYYGETEHHHWVDCFHTGYNLDALKCYLENGGHPVYEDNLVRGYEYFKAHFIESTGRPKYYFNRAYPIDIQCASQAIDTLVYFSDRDPEALGLGSKVANWTIENMQAKSGFFYYRILPLRTVRVPMIHWGQATMYKALTYLMTKL